MRERAEFKISKEQRPDLNSRERQQLAYQMWQASLTADDIEELAEEKREAREAIEQYHAEKEARDQAALAAWPGNRRVARWIENRLRKAEVRYTRFDASTGSIYFETAADKLRVADHVQPVGGAYNTETGERGGQPTVDVTPWTADWRAAVEEIIQRELED